MGQRLHLRILRCSISDGTIRTLSALNSGIRFVSGIILHHSIVITVHDISHSVDPRFITLWCCNFSFRSKNPLLVHVCGKQIRDSMCNLHGQRRKTTFVIFHYFEYWEKFTIWLPDWCWCILGLESEIGVISLFFCGFLWYWMDGPDTMADPRQSWEKTLLLWRHLVYEDRFQYTSELRQHFEGWHHAYMLSNHVVRDTLMWLLDTNILTPF
jgi:hypothetical protein